MKRLVLILLVVAVLIGAGIYFFCCRGAAVSGAKFVPADTVLFLALPDMPRTDERWPKTALAQIGAEPTVADFLAQPIQKLTEGGGAEAKEILTKLDPKQMFFALTAVRRSAAPHVLLGFEYSGKSEDLDAAFSRLYAQAGKMGPGFAQTSADFKGDKVTALTTGSKPVLYTAAHGKWAFLSNDESSIQQALDRVSGRDNSPSLAGTDEYKKVLSHLAKEPDFLWYSMPTPIFKLLMEVSKDQPGSNPAAFKQLEKMKALGGTLVFEGGDQRELTFILYPEAPKLSPIDRGPMALTTPGTSFFLDSAMDTKTISTDEYFQSLPPAAQTFLTNAKIDLKQIPEILGTDAGFLMDWPVSAFIPNTLVAIEIKDRARAQALIQSTLTGFGLDATPSESNGAAIFHFPAAQLVEPSIAVTDKFVLGSLTAGELTRALTVKPGSPTLETAADFKPALSAYKKAGVAFGYVDSKALFERIYNMIRPMAILLGAGSPQLAQVVDVKKLPETGVISSHLSPILYTNDQTSDGILIESSGPITLSQAFAIVVIGGAAGFAAQSQMAGGMH
ncbi:MAG: DUF3352 domain-containing protein [Chthoniobacterales bacterium]